MGLHTCLMKWSEAPSSPPWSRRRLRGLGRSEGPHLARPHLTTRRQGTKRKMNEQVHERGVRVMLLYTLSQARS